MNLSRAVYDSQSTLIDKKRLSGFDWSTHPIYVEVPSLSLEGTPSTLTSKGLRVM